jgi:hypothetical protein
MQRRSDLLSISAPDLLAGVAQDCDELTNSLKSPEAQRRLTLAARLQLQAMAIDRKLRAARMAVEVRARLQQIAPVDTWMDEFNQLLDEVDPSFRKTVLDRIRARLDLYRPDTRRCACGGLREEAPPGPTDSRQEAGSAAESETEQR